MLRKFSALLALLVVFGFAIDFSDIVRASNSLETVSFHVVAERFVKRRTVVEFDFASKRPNMMRIEYTYPKSVKGSIVAIDGEYVYNYIPSLNKRMKKRIGKGSKNPGKEMGILFDHVAGYDEKELRSWRIEFEGEEKVEIGGKGVETYVFEIEGKEDRERVWFGKRTLFPVKIDMYSSGKLTLRITVSDLKINPKFDESIFRLF